ncbi:MULTISPECIES: FxSxx-COOH system tetratricopeptide repeat protein [Nonomuraea]|uniref:FxSxx-COOH system tetratricopeptide repeat protein n=1 Tax=Nonomuraea ferruginea TaxID=46174 RepID=A0ABT4SQV5_9ACTN|nr:FxSxx-COOH system tetratricopeptide repeat protein [Nonomuraea ferruginea]MDA0639430.1 FxSxx-COOH system tetratricopeptide repeat protein [Nonomuraea ferruginea]
MTESEHEGQVVTFYSYKGGAGRTMALANTAWLLASNGLRVLAIDWDLESPGLHKYFHPFLDSRLIESSQGVIDIVSNYSWEATREHEGADWYRDYAKVSPHAVPVEWDFPAAGMLYFLSAGQQNRDYSSLVTTFDWDNFYGRIGGGSFLDALRADMKAQYDYALIDSRTGLSDIADICTMQMPDILVDCFTMADQSIEGAAKVARYIHERYAARKIRILPVPARIDDGEKEKLDAGRALARSKFEKFPGGMSPEEAQQYWGRVEIPYKRFYAFEETLAVFGDLPGSPTSLLAAYERLTEFITEGRVTSFPGMDEATRTRFLEAYTRKQPVQQADLLLSYVPEDRMWADWAVAVLTHAGFRVVPRIAGKSAPEGEGCVLVLLSGAYARVARSTQVPHPLGADAFGSRQVIPLMVSEYRGAVPFTERPAVDLASLGAEQAAETLLRVVGRPDDVSGYDIPAVSPSFRFPLHSPDVWSVPTRNASFTGRNRILESLRDRLVGGDDLGSRPQALFGLGGVGKTQIALEYAHRFKADYGLVWWVPSNDVGEINRSLAALAVRLGIRFGDSIADGAKAALEALRRGQPHARWLLTFDNAEDAEALRPFLPGGPGHVLITSRSQAWSSVAVPLEIDVFSREEGVEHLLRRVPRLAADEALQIADALGYLPLAIEQAAAWLEETSMSAGMYLTELETQTLNTLDLNQPDDYPHSVAATWEISFNQLNVRSPAAGRLLQLCAFFAPESISQSLVYSDRMLEVLRPFDETLRDKLVLGRIIRDIGRYALAQVDQGNNTIQVHRLVQKVIRSRMREEEALTAEHEVHRILAAARPRQGEVDDPENWPQYELLWPHLGPSGAITCTEEQVRLLLTEYVRYLYKRGDFENALARGQELARTWEAEFGAGDGQRLHLQFQIANALRSLGRFEEARELDEEVRDAQRSLYGDSHYYTMLTSGSLAADLRALGRFDEALAMDRETYERWKDAYGEDYPRTLTSANNLAVSYRLVGDPYSAMELDQETRRRMQASSVMGPSHPDTLNTTQNLARDMREAGEYQASIELLKGALPLYREVLGENYLHTLRAGKSLAVSLRKAGQYQEALGLVQDTYQRYQRLYPSAPETKAAALEVATCMSVMGHKESARDMTAKVVEDYTELLGVDHPYTLVAANNLMVLRRAVGDVEPAHREGERVLESFRHRLGENHPFTLACTVNLANCAADLGDLEQARTLEVRALDGLRRCLRPEHPDSLICQANLAITLREVGQRADAELLHAKALDRLAVTLGGSHPSVVAAHEWERLNRDLEPQPT